MYVDGGVSGATLAKRGGIQELIEDARKKKFGIVIAKSVSRLGRNMRENLNMAHELESLGLRLVLPEDDYDSMTKRSRLSFHLKAMLAEEESAKMSERIKLGLQASALRGRVLSSLPPFGYKKNNGSAGNLELDERFAPIVRKIFDLYLYEGWGWFKITRYLNECGIPTPRKVSGARNAGHLWHESSVRVILQNVVYTGRLEQHREETMDFITKKRREVPKGQRILHENAHPAIITDQEYEAVQDKMRSKGLNRTNGHESLFAHIAICGDCGKGMVFRKDRGKGGAYVCGGYVKHTRTFCSSHLIRNADLINGVKDDLRQLLQSEIKLQKVFRAAYGEIDSRISTKEKELKRVTRRLMEIDKEFQNLLLLFNRNVISIEQFQTQNEKLIDEQKNCSQQKLDLEQEQELKKDSDDLLKKFQKQIEKIASLDIEDEQVLKTVLQKLVHRVEIDASGTIKRICYNFANPAPIGA